MKALFVLLSLALTGCALSQLPLHLELASVVFRHGDRSPVHTFPTDNYTEWDWPQGYGQLSIVGMQQQHRLGTLLSQRYIVNGTCDGLVCANYTRVQVRVRSTDTERTLMSAASQLSGFFPPNENETFLADLAWQPIPIHTTPLLSDSLLRPVDYCPTYAQLLEKDQQSAEYKAVEEEYKDFLSDLTKFTGMPVNLSSIWSIQDTVFIESISPGYEAPAWATPERMEILSKLSEYTLTRMFNGTEKNRLTAGVWLGKILTDMKNKVNASGNKTLEDMKLFLYSAHDTTVAAMTSALGVFNNHQPGYATAFLVELYSDENGKYYVQMFSRNGPDSDTFDPLNATFCANKLLCTLEEFEQYVAPLVPSDLLKECEASSAKVGEMTVAVIALGSALSIVLIITIVLTVIMISVCRKKHAKDKKLYGALLADENA